MDEWLLTKTEWIESYDNLPEEASLDDIRVAKCKAQAKKLLEGIENRAIILSNKDGTGILMFALDDWEALKKEIM